MTYVVRESKGVLGVERHSLTPTPITFGEKEEDDDEEEEEEEQEEEGKEDEGSGGKEDGDTAMEGDDAKGNQDE